MTRETKVGMVVSASFLCLVGGVLAVKYIRGSTQPPKTAAMLKAEEEAQQPPAIEMPPGFGDDKNPPSPPLEPIPTIKPPYGLPAVPPPPVVDTLPPSRPGNLLPPPPKDDPNRDDSFGSTLPLKPILPARHDEPLLPVPGAPTAPPPPLDIPKPLDLPKPPGWLDLDPPPPPVRGGARLSNPSKIAFAGGFDDKPVVALPAPMPEKPLLTLPNDPPPLPKPAPMGGAAPKPIDLPKPPDAPKPIDLPKPFDLPKPPDVPKPMGLPPDLTKPIPSKGVIGGVEVELPPPKTVGLEPSEPMPPKVSGPTLPPGLKDNPPAAAIDPRPRPAELQEPRVESYDEEWYYCKPNDTLEGISQKFFFTPKYEQSLRQYNLDRNYSPTFRADKPSLSQGNVVKVPPARVLERLYPNAIPGFRPTANPRPAATPGAAAEPTVPAAAAAEDLGAPREITIRREGMTLRDVAKEELRATDQWPRIIRLNPSFNPNEPIPVGTKIFLPRAQ